MTGGGLGVLFMGGAKRVSMARHFKAACPGLRLYSYELTEREPIACEAKVIIGMRWRDPGIYDDLHRVCTEHGIRVVVPFVDGAVAVAAELSARWPGEIFAPASPAPLAETMFDKVAANTLFTDLGLPVPQTYGSGYDRLPLIAKPRHGSASKGIVVIDSKKELDMILPVADDYLIQEYIAHRRELTVDCYVSMLNGEVLAAVPRVRDDVTGGEVDRTTVIHHPAAEELVHRTLRNAGLRGAVTVQLIEDRDDGRLMLMEINPRLGGGAVAAIAAGADLPAMIMAEAQGRQPRPCTHWRDLLLTRYRAEVVFYKD